MTSVSLWLNLMKITDSKIWLWDLFLNCPLGNETEKFPFKKIRKETVNYKFNYIENLTARKIDKLYHHTECLYKREQLTTGAIFTKPFLFR